MPSYNVHSILGSLFGLGTSDPQARFHVASGPSISQVLVDTAVGSTPAFEITADGIVHCYIGLSAATTITFPGLTATRIPFATTGGVLLDDADLVWDNINKRLGVGVSPSDTLHVDGSIRAAYKSSDGTAGATATLII